MEFEKFHKLTLKSIKESYNLYRDDQFVGNIPAVTPYYLAGVNKARQIVKKFMNKPSFTDKLK